MSSLDTLLGMVFGIFTVGAVAAGLLGFFAPVNGVSFLRGALMTWGMMICLVSVIGGFMFLMQKMGWM